MMMEAGEGAVKPPRPGVPAYPEAAGRRGRGPAGRRGGTVGFHHVAITTRDPEATHRFYTEVLGFSLVRVEAAPGAEGGWARHLFYDTGNGECLAVWDLHDNPA